MPSKRITESGFTDHPAHGRAFRTAMAVTGGLLFAQALAIGYGILRREPIPLPAVTAPAPAPVAETAVPAAAPPVLPDPALAGDPSPTVPATAPAAPGPVEAETTPLFAALAAAARDRVLGDAILERLMVAGTELRDNGNTQRALQAYRQVESALPEDPRVLSEIAATLGRMGLKDQAEGYWKRVEAVGSLAAGPYFPIAGGQLRGEVPVVPAAPAVPVAPTSPAAPAIAASSPALSAPPVPAGLPPRMRIGEIKVEEQAPTSEGQKVRLSVVIDADPASMPVGDDLSLFVYFYDRLPSGEIRPSTADTSYLYPTEPYDWQVNGTETILVDYHQPAFTEEQKRELGERVYHGYAAALFYRDELQEKVIRPDDIPEPNFGPSPPDDGADAAPIKPDGSLFPTPAAP
mgnify:CR=1 FL=1